jgi:signal transduction histidine kinase
MDIKFLGILSGLFLVFLGYVVWYKNKKHPANISLSVFAMSSAFWCVSLYFYENPIIYTPRLWITLVFFFVFFMVGSTLYFSFVFPNGNPKAALIPIIFYSIFSLPFVYLLLFTKYWIKNVIVVSGSTSIIMGPFYIFWGVFNMLFGMWIIDNFIKRYKESGPLNRLQLRYVFMGIGIMAVTTLVVDVIIPVVFKNSGYFWISSLSIVPFIGLSSYAIIKHRLFDIRLLIARSISYSLLLVILGILYASGLFIVSTLIIKKTESLTGLIDSTILALIIAYTFQPLRIWLEKITNKIFFKERYETEALLNTLSKTMATSLTLDDLSLRILTIITKELRITEATFAIINDKDVYIVDNQHQQKHQYITKSDVEKMASPEKLLILDEIEEGPQKDFMRKNDISLAVPLSTKQHFVGFLLLGGKSSGEIFFDQDVNFLSILGPELAVALQNAQRFEEISKFNVTLQEEVKNATGELQTANEKLKKLDQIKDEFISIASHDLRSPMATVKNYIWLARSELGKAAPKAKKDLDIALESTEHGISLVADMLDVSRIEAGRIELNTEKLDLKRETELIVDELQKQASDKKISLSADVSDGLIVNADKERIHQVLTNLTGNAIKFTPPNGKVIITGSKKEKMIEISISDTGIGIKKEDLGKLFTKFGKLENGTSVPSSQGTGLGLFISKNMVELSGGKIWVESTPGKGSKFNFTLPSS